MAHKKAAGSTRNIALVLSALVARQLKLEILLFVSVVLTFILVLIWVVVKITHYLQSQMVLYCSKLKALKIVNT